MSDLVENSEDRFSDDYAHLLLIFIAAFKHNNIISFMSKASISLGCDKLAPSWRQRSAI